MVFGPAQPRLPVAELAASLKSTSSWFWVKSVLCNTLYLHTAICTVHKAFTLFNIHALHLKSLNSRGLAWHAIFTPFRNIMQSLPLSLQSSKSLSFLYFRHQFSTRTLNFKLFSKLFSLLCDSVSILQQLCASLLLYSTYPYPSAHNPKL